MTERRIMRNVFFKRKHDKLVAIKKESGENWGTTGPYFTLRGAIRLMDERGEGRGRLL